MTATAATATTNATYTPAVRTSWLTGKATEPNKNCVRCKGEATCWVAHRYQSGKKGRVATGYRPTCAACQQPYADEQNAKAEVKAQKPARTSKAKGNARKDQRKGKENAAEVTVSPEEAALVGKYSSHTIKSGSLLMANDPANPFQGKRVVTIVCSCGAERQLCTSDLHHVRHCKVCSIDVRKGRRATKKAKAELK